MSSEIDTYALANGHPPSAANTVLVDFDKTIRPWGAMESRRLPFPGAPEALQHVRELGYRLVILTSRASQSWWQAESERRGTNPLTFGIEQLRYVESYLRHYEIPFDEITAEKKPGLVLFDDTAVRISPEYPLAQAVADWLASRGQA